MSLICQLFIISAALLYTISIWAELLSNALKKYIIVLLWLGMLSDTLFIFTSYFTKTRYIELVIPMGILLAILMFIKIVLSTIYYLKDKYSQNLRLYGTVVWFVWLFYYIIIFIMG